MTRRKSMSRNHKRPMTCAPWSDLDHNVLHIVMMRLGVVEFLSFRGVCKSWRSLACKNQNKFMASMPPMPIRIFRRALKKTCYLEDYDGRKFKIILPEFTGGNCIGLTCGYLIFFIEGTSDFWLVNPITKKLLRFPDFPIDDDDPVLSCRATLVFSPSISGWVFVVLCKYSKKIWFSIEGKRAWNCVSQSFYFTDVYAFKGKIYTLSHNLRYPTTHERYRLCELGLSPQPKLTILEIKKPDGFSPDAFVSSGEKLYAMDSISRGLNDLHELDLGEMKWVKASEKTLEEYAFFRSHLNHVVVAVKPESWADPRARSCGGYISFQDTDNIYRTYELFTPKMWYFPHQCMNVDRVD